MFSGVPISVTYCDLADCVRVLTSESRGYPLALDVGGLDANNKLVLLYGEEMYPQASQRLPLPDYPFYRTTWGQWKSQHPDSQVVVVR